MEAAATVVGRSRECDLRIEDPAASRKHFRLEQRGDDLWVTDLGSSNGTYRNGRRLREEERLETGDVLLVGETEMRVRVLGTGTVDVAGGPSATVRIPTLAAAPPSAGETPSRGVPASPPPPPAAPGPPELPSKPPAPAAPEAPTAAAPDAPVLPDIDSVVLKEEPASLPVPSEAPEAPRHTTRSGARPEFPPPAGFWIRLAAVVVDAVLISVVSLLVALPFGGSAQFVVLSLLTWVLSIAVPVVGWARWGTTPGKRLFGLVLCSTDGDVGLAWGQAAIRWVGYLLSGFLFGAGFLMVAFSASKRGLHDHLAGTYVGKGRPGR